MKMDNDLIEYIDTEINKIENGNFPLTVNELVTEEEENIYYECTGYAISVLKKIKAMIE